jgi:hypothetical protein
VIAVEELRHAPGDFLAPIRAMRLLGPRPDSLPSNGKATIRDKHAESKLVYSSKLALACFSTLVAWGFESQVKGFLTIKW